MFNVYGPGQDLNNLKQGMVSIYLAQAIKSSKIIIKEVSQDLGILYSLMMLLRLGLELLNFLQQ